MTPESYVARAPKPALSEAEGPAPSFAIGNRQSEMLLHAPVSQPATRNWFPHLIRMSEEQTAVFGGGCFWCLEAVFARATGVKSVESGYMGGRRENPTYEQVCTGASGHVEVVRVTFDPAQIAYRDLLDIFFTIHDPTTLNRQGNDSGTQYRSVIFYASDDQRSQAEQAIADLTAARAFPNPIVTAVEPAKQFYVAENYHQGYYAGNSSAPYCQYVIAPKLKKFEQKFPQKTAT
jgi:peptide-methionine (S)-S-oxide reductase